MEATVRRARPDDYSQVARLYDSLDALHLKRAPWMFKAPDAQPRPEDFFLALLESNDAVLFVADVGHVVGFVHGLLRDPPDFPVFISQRWAVLDGILVDAQWRRHGIGRRLVQAFEAWAYDQHAPWTELNVYEFNAEATDFYRSLGYLPLSTKLRKPSPDAT